MAVLARLLAGRKLSIRLRCAGRPPLLMAPDIHLPDESQRACNRSCRPNHFAARLLFACDWSSVGFNSKCKQYCASVNVTQYESEADISSALKADVRTMGWHGTPQLIDKNKIEIGFPCPE